MDIAGNHIYGYMTIIGVCGIVLFIVVMKRKWELFVNLVLRTVLGVIGIYCMDEFLKWQCIEVVVGINPLTALTSGILGIPGLLLLFGVQFFKFL